MSQPDTSDVQYQPVWARSNARAGAARRDPSFKRLILNLIVIGLVGAAISFVVAPVVAFFGIRAAAEAGDVGGLSRLIDYDAVRASLRPQLSGRPEPLTPPPSFLEDPLGAVRRQFDQATAPRPAQAPDVEAYLTPDALTALMRGQGRGATTTAVSTEAAPWPALRYWGVNRARMGVSDDVGASTVFTFDRRGPFEWKLVHIGLPGDGATNPAAR